MTRQFRKWGETNAPCRDCQLRKAGCHSDCPKDKSEEYEFYGYAAFKADAEKQRKMRSEFLKATDALVEIHLRGRNRL